MCESTADGSYATTLPSGAGSAQDAGRWSLSDRPADAGVADQRISDPDSTGVITAPALTAATRYDRQRAACTVIGLSPVLDPSRVPIASSRSVGPLWRARPFARGTVGVHVLTHARIRSFTAVGCSTCRKWPALSTTSILDPVAR
jgi:hypothetical protein